MPHSLAIIWIHTVFGTKERKPFIRPEFEQALHDHLRINFEDDFKCQVNIINGMFDHVHILFLLEPNYAVANVLKNIKSESSHRINQKNLIRTKFAWQIGYGAFSVSQSNVENVRRYIQRQKEHHRKVTFREEYEQFMKKHGLSLIGGVGE